MISDFNADFNFPVIEINSTEIALREIMLTLYLLGVKLTLYIYIYIYGMCVNLDKMTLRL